MTPSLRLNHLLVQLTEFRETFSTLDDGFIMKGQDSGTASRKRCKGKGRYVGKSPELPYALRWRSP